MDVPGFLNDSPWFQLLQQREKEAGSEEEVFEAGSVSLLYGPCC